MDILKKITVLMCVTLLLVMSICPAFTVVADESVVTLDLSNGCITISPTGIPRMEAMRWNIPGHMS